MMNEKFKEFGLGINVTQVQLQNIVPPKGVQDAFEDVNKAIQDMNRLVNEGKESYNSEIPKPRARQTKSLRSPRVMPRSASTRPRATLLVSIRSMPSMLRLQRSHVSACTTKWSRMSSAERKTSSSSTSTSPISFRSRLSAARAQESARAQGPPRAPTSARASQRPRTRGHPNEARPSNRRHRPRRAFLIVLLLGPFYTVKEGEQAVIVRFGKIIGTQTTAGLKLRSPFIDVVVKYPKMVMPWDGEPQRIQTKENQFIWVDSHRALEDRHPVKFYESIGTLESAYGKLDDVLDSAVRTVIAGNFLREAVRDSTISSAPTSRRHFRPATRRDRPPLRTSLRARSAMTR